LRRFSVGKLRLLIGNLISTDRSGTCKEELDHYANLEEEKIPDCLESVRKGI
jgi:hypothetical protein